jgi:hypothetical protein
MTVDVLATFAVIGAGLPFWGAAWAVWNHAKRVYNPNCTPNPAAGLELIVMLAAGLALAAHLLAALLWQPVTW